MWCNQIFSLIKPVDGVNEIQNIIVCDNYEVANQIARLNYGGDAYAVDTTYYPLTIGCKHVGGKFYSKDGTTEIPKNPTAEEQVEQVKAENTALEERLALAESAINMLLLGQEVNTNE